MRYTLLLVLAAVPAAFAQGPKIGVLDFYGLRKVPEEKIRKALDIKEGDLLPRSKGDVEERLEQVQGVVRARLEATCCADSQAILYVGIEEKGAPHFNYHDPPKESVAVPAEIFDTYEKFLHAVEHAAREGNTAEDLSRGHSLMADAEARQCQLRFVELAAEHFERLRKVLRESADEEHRAVAAYVIGYAPNKRLIVDDLQWAMRDPDDTVRANAMRALGAIAELAAHDPDQEVRFSPTWFIEMLNSLVWTDRNNAAVALVNLTEKRDGELLSRIRERALDAVLEMAAWKHLPHALPAFILAGRLAGLEEQAIQDAWNRGDRQVVIEKARRKRK